MTSVYKMSVNLLMSSDRQYHLGNSKHKLYWENCVCTCFYAVRAAAVILLSVSCMAVRAWCKPSWINNHSTPEGIKWVDNLITRPSKKHPASPHKQFGLMNMNVFHYSSLTNTLYHHHNQCEKKLLFREKKTFGCPTFWLSLERRVLHCFIYISLGVLKGLLSLFFHSVSLWRAWALRSYWGLTVQGESREALSLMKTEGPREKESRRRAPREC